MYWGKYAYLVSLGVNETYYIDFPSLLRLWHCKSVLFQLQLVFCRKVFLQHSADYAKNKKRRNKAKGERSTPKKPNSQVCLPGILHQTNILTSGAPDRNDPVVTGQMGKSACRLARADTAACVRHAPWLSWFPPQVSPPPPLSLSLLPLALPLSLPQFPGLTNSTAEAWAGRRQARLLWQTRGRNYHRCDEGAVGACTSGR